MPETAPAGRILNLLVVDDDADTRIALRHYLEKVVDGMVVQLAAYGAEAMRKMESTAVDVLLTDKDMPGMGGGQLVAWTRERHPGIRCLVMTGDPDHDLEALGSGLGVRILRKPFTDADLAELVEAVRA
jgi:CheY-like chemotaxis protein